MNVWVGGWGGKRGVEDLYLEMLLHIMYHTHSLGIFVIVALEDLKVKLPATPNMPA